MKTKYLQNLLCLLLILPLFSCVKPKETEAPKDFTSFDSLLLQGEPRREEAQAQVKDEETYSHVISLLSNYQTPGNAATIAWNAHHLLLTLGEPALLSLQKRQDKTPLERFTEERLLRRMGLTSPPKSPFYEAFCGSNRLSSAILLRYESGREEAEGRTLFQVNNQGTAHITVKHTIKPAFNRSFNLSEIELSFLFDRVCASYFWESFPRRESGAEGEDGVLFSVSITPDNQERTSQELLAWGGEWRVGPTERLAKMLDAIVARGKQTSLLLP